VPLNSAMALYLSRNVAAIPLPELFDDDETFAPLVLDGASGIGKTQQALALLRAEAKLVYLNLHDASMFTQQIYSEMKRYASVAGAIDLVNDAIKSVKEFSLLTGRHTKDPFLMDAMTAWLGSCCMNKRLKELKYLIMGIYESQIQYDVITG